MEELELTTCHPVNICGGALFIAYLNQHSHYRSWSCLVNQKKLQKLGFSLFFNTGREDRVRERSGNYTY
jgi:hypothetical protein